jgi:Mg-chelatase subunit ChlD
MSFSGEDITIAVSATVKTTFMHVANIDYIDVGAKTTITKKQRNIELVLVLDTTGSMSSSGKITALKSAANQMVNILFDGKSTSDTLKIGVVPFAAAVNIGADKLNSGWLDKTAATVISYEDFKAGVKVLDLYSPGGLSNRSWAGCVRERGGSYELTDDAPSSGTPATLWAPYFAPDEPSSSSYANNYLSDGSYSGATCYNGSTDNDKRQCYTGKYTAKSVSSTSVGPDFSCPPAKVTALTNFKSTVVAAINALSPKGSTAIPTGLLWGWRVSSPTQPFTEGVAYDDPKWVKAMVLLTDGENDVGGGGNGFDKSYYSAFGFAKNGHLGSTNGSQAEAQLDSKTTTLCNSIKDKGILLYTIGLQVSTASQTLLKGCATKLDMFYNSPTGTQLAAIFQDIAQGLSDLRIAK